MSRTVIGAVFLAVVAVGVIAAAANFLYGLFAENLWPFLTIAGGILVGVLLARYRDRGGETAWSSDEQE